MVHSLKTEKVHFINVIEGRKTFEVRKNDKEYRVGDLIALNEWDKDKQRYTGNSCICYIDFILNDDNYCKEGYVILNIKPCVVHRYGRPYNPHTEGCDYTVPLASEGGSYNE